MKKSNWILLIPYITSLLVVVVFLVLYFNTSRGKITKEAMEFMLKFDQTEIHVVQVNPGPCPVKITNKAPKSIETKYRLSYLVLENNGLKISNDTLYITIPQKELGIIINDPAILSVVADSTSDVIFERDTIR